MSLPSVSAPPSSNNDEARRRAAQQAAQNQQQQGRRATILTSPLGDPNFGKSVSRTVLTGLNPA
jgi:hypothetical protein